MMGQLPERYQENMQELLGEAYDAYLESFSKSPCTAFRVNTSKVSLEEWKRHNPFEVLPVPWAENGFYYDAGKVNPAKHPYYYAGLYYIQEPSAMLPASLLPVAEGDRVLDLCAAPGGKATELGARLKGTGILAANDISVSRTRALVRNIQLAGICNAMVTAETPERLAENFAGYFDKILVDAPCSGEGMFRREPRMIKDWLERGPEYYTVLQREILEQAYQMLRPGGSMVYSTCTFSVPEDEGMVQWFVQEHPDMEICPVEREKGFSGGRPDMVDGGLPELKHCVRIFPHCADGEGHFAVLLRKQGEADRQPMPFKKEHQPAKRASKEGSGKKKTAAQPAEAAEREMEDFLHSLPPFGGRKELWGQSAVLLPVEAGRWEGLRVVCQGLPLCEWKHKLLPARQLALALKSEDFGQVLDMGAEDERTIRYLKGETISVEGTYRGNVLVCVDGFGLGWAQGNGAGSLKNKYHPGWRYQ